MTEPTFDINGFPKMGNMERTQFIQATIKRIGPQVTQEDVNNELVKRGQHKIVAEATFMNNYYRVFYKQSTREDKEPGLESEPTKETAREIPIIEPSDRLSNYIRFASAVYMVGGIEKARKYLEVMESMDSL